MLQRLRVTVSTLNAWVWQTGTTIITLNVRILVLTFTKSNLDKTNFTTNIKLKYQNLSLSVADLVVHLVNFLNISTKGRKVVLQLPIKCLEVHIN
jgi:hypothetical protein